MSVASHHARSRGAVAAAFFWQGLVFIHLTTRLPELTDRWHLTETRLSLLLLLMVLLAGAGSALAERRAGRRGSAEALVAGLLVVGLAPAALGASPTLWLFVLALAAYGLALGTVDAGSNMQAVALEHHYGRTILPSFHGAWTLGGMTGAALTLATAGHSRATLAGALVIAAASLLFLAAGFLPAEEAGPGTGPELAVPWRPLLLVGLGLVVFYMVDTAATTWARRTSTARSTPRPGWSPSRPSPTCWPAGCCGSSATASSRRTARSRCCGRAGCSRPPPWPWSWAPRPGRWRCWASPCSAPGSR